MRRAGVLSICMTKKELRERYKQQRASLPEKERLRLNDLLLIQFQQMQIAPDLNVLLTYWPLDVHHEVNTFLMTDFLHFRIPGLQVAYPVADFDDHSMTIMLVEEDTAFEKNRYGIAEPVNGTIIDPTEIDMIFVPLLVFDKQGYRIGYGQGFYDRFLPSCRKESIKIGFSWFEPVEAIEDIGQFDVPLTTGITPVDIYEF